MCFLLLGVAVRILLKLAAAQLAYPRGIIVLPPMINTRALFPIIILYFDKVDGWKKYGSTVVPSTSSLCALGVEEAPYQV